jgi:hypothetical protein
MRNFRTLSINELQSYGISGDEEALLELGKRVMNMPINDHDSQLFCEYRFELEELQAALDIEIPLDCPHCGGWLTDV